MGFRQRKKLFFSFFETFRLYIIILKTMTDFQFHVNKNAQSTGEHEVHQNGCSHQPDLKNRKALGSCVSCRGAITKAKQYYDNVDGCKYCCSACHTR
jgi:hypothetical protein